MDGVLSFNVDHTALERGIYLAGKDDDISTYDIRMKTPYKQEVLDNASIHTIEHLFAYFVRGGEFKKNIVYFGPMGCRTGFYFLVRDLSDSETLDLTIKGFEFIASFEGDIPGAKKSECGAWRDHSLEGAKAQAKEFLTVLKQKTVSDMRY